MIKLAKRYLSSSKLKKNIITNYNKLDGLKPISLYDLSLTYIMKNKILKLHKNNNIHIHRDLKKLTLIIPYRHRKKHLEEFIPTIKSYLEKQNIDYEIIIVDQDDKKNFNKAKLMNIGSLHASEDSEYFIFHDVDLLPENIDYRYCNHTLKLFNFIDNEEYEETIFGGAILVPKQIFFDINGFSNMYWQWGKEDDDFFLRHILKGYLPLYDTNGKFTALPHPPSLTQEDAEGNYIDNADVINENKKLYQKNKKIFSDFKRGISHQDSDGINNIKNYNIVSVTDNKNIKVIKVTF